MAGAWTAILGQEVSFRVKFVHGGAIRLKTKQTNKQKKTGFSKSKEATSDLLHFYMQEK